MGHVQHAGGDPKFCRGPGTGRGAPVEAQEDAAVGGSGGRGRGHLADELLHTAGLVVPVH
eukprot:11208878-Lingulodinium_polyedra.AAC.2